MKFVIPFALVFWLVACGSETDDSGGEKNSEEKEEMVGTVTRTQYEEIKNLLGIWVGLIAWSQTNEDRAYPDSIANEEFRESLVEHRDSGEVKSPIYVRGHSVEGNDTDVLLASPWVYGDKRVVVYSSGTTECIDESLFQKQLTATLEQSSFSLDE